MYVCKAETDICQFFFLFFFCPPSPYNVAGTFNVASTYDVASTYVVASTYDVASTFDVASTYIYIAIAR